jgi:hypothetical protein
MTDNDQPQRPNALGLADKQDLTDAPVISALKPNAQWRTLPAFMEQETLAPHCRSDRGESGGDSC